MANSGDVMRVRLSAEGIQEVMASLKKVQQEVGKTGKAGKDAGDALGSLSTLFAAQKMASFVASALEAADGLFKMAQKTGVAVEQLSVFSYMAQQAEVSNEDLTKGFGKLAKSLDLLASGDAKTTEAFKRIGLGAADLKGLKLDDAMLKIARASSNFADGQGKAAVAMQIFGKSGSNMIPLLNDLSNNGFENAKNKLQALGLVISTDMARSSQDFNDSMKRVELAAQGATVQVAQTMLPGLTKGLDLLTEALAGTPTAVKTFTGSLLGIGVAATASIKAVQLLYGAIAGLGPIGIAVVAIAALTAGIIALQSAEDQARKEELESIGRRRDFVGSSESLEKAYRKEAEALKKSVGNQQEADKHSRRLKEITDQLVAMSPDLQQTLKNEAMSWGEKANAIKKAREEQEKQQDLDRKKVEQDLAQARSDAVAQQTYENSKRRALGQDEISTADIQNPEEAWNRGKISTDALLAQRRIRGLQEKLNAFSRPAAEASATGPDKPPVGGVMDDSLAKAKIAALTATSKRSLEEVKSMLESLSAELEQSYKNGLMSLEDFLGSRELIVRAGMKAEADAIQQQIQAEEKTPAITAADKVAKITKLADLKAQIALKQEEGERKIQALEFEGDEKRRAAAQEALKLEVELESAKGQTGKAALDAIDAEYEERIRMANDPQLKAQLHALKENAIARKSLEGSQRGVDVGQKNLDNALTAIDLQRQNGSISEPQAIQKQIDAYEKWIWVMADAAQKQKDLAEQTGDQGLIADADAQILKIDGLAAALKRLKDPMADLKLASRDAIQNGLTDFLASVGDQTTSLSEKFRNLGRSIAQAMLQAASAKMAGMATNAIFGLFGGGAPGKAEGGLIEGPGTGTSDSILSRLSNGEFVNRTASVAYYGPEFFHALNGMRIPKSMLPGFADGGLVGGAVSKVGPASQAGGNTRIVNLFDPSLLEGLMKTPKGEKAILNVIASNPEFMRALLR